jgi:ABC-type transport system involved in cytochrome c biogenesis permease subunit
MKTLLCFCVLFLAAGLALANGKMAMRAPTPNIKPGKVVLRTTLEVIPDAQANEARLQITQSTLNELRAGINDGAGNTAIAATVSQSPTRTIVAGLLMFLAVSVAGVLLARSARSASFGRTQKAVVALILIVGVIAAAAIITRGNAGPPGSFRWRNLPQALTQGQATAGGVDIEIVPDEEMVGTRFRLIIPLKNPTPGAEE